MKHLKDNAQQIQQYANESISRTDSMADDSDADDSYEVGKIAGQFHNISDIAAEIIEAIEFIENNPKDK